MDKYAVDNVKKMQRDALVDVRRKLGSLRTTPHTKTAAEVQEMENLERQERELEEALAQPDPA